MSEKTLSILSVVAGFMILLAAFVGCWYEPTIQIEFAKGRLLIPNLDPAQIRAITVEKGEEKVSLKRSGKQFLVDSMRNYPAANREVNTLIRNVLGVRCDSEASSDASSHEELGLAGGEDTETVVFTTAEGSEPIRVIVGKSAEGGGGKYVRLGSSDTVYRTEEWISLRARGLDYVDKELLSLTRDDIAKVTVSPPAGKTYTVVSPEAGKFELPGVPEGKKVKGTEHEGVFGAATYLSFTDFQSESEAKDLAFDHTYIVETRHKAEYRLEVAKHVTKKEKTDGEGDDAAGENGDGAETEEVKWWIRCSARYLGPQSLDVEGKTDEELKENEKLAQAAKAVEEFNARHQSWVYEISSWTAESMAKSFDELIEDDDGKPDEVAASHILVAYQGASRAGEDVTRTKEEAKARAEELLAQVQADPGTFADVAKDSSDGPSAEKGGDLGTFKFEAMAQPFSEAAFALEVDQICDSVVETEFGFHIIKRTK